MNSIAHAAPAGANHTATRVPPIEEGRATSHTAQGAERPRPVACMTGLAKDVIPALQDCAMSQKAKRLMARIVAGAMGNAGLETEHPEEAGLWCDMDTAGWAGEVQCSKQYMSYLVEQLITFRLISRHPAPQVPKGASRAIVSCRLRINPHLAEWQPLQAGAHTQRYAKKGAGRPRKAASQRTEPDFQPARVPNQISQRHKERMETGQEQMPSDVHAPERKGGRAREIESDSLRSVGGMRSGSLRLPAQKGISFVTLGSLEERAGEASAVAERKITEETIPEEFHFRGADAPEAGDEEESGTGGGDITQRQQALCDLQRKLHKMERSRSLASGPYYRSLKAQEQRLLDALAISTTLGASVPEAEMPPPASEAEKPPAPAASNTRSLAISPEQLAHFRQELTCQRERVQAAAVHWETSMAERRHCLDATRRKELIHEVCQAEQHYHEAQRKLARFELAIEALSAGHTVEEAVALAHERIGAATSQTTQSAEREPSEAETTAAAPEKPYPPVPLLEGEVLRRALFSKLVTLFLPGDPPDKADVDLSRGVFNTAIKQFMVKQLQPSDVEVLQAVYQRVWPKAACTAPALAKHIPFLVSKAREMGYHLSLA